MKLFLFFSHKLTDEQIIDAKNSLKISEFVNLPSDLQANFSQVPAEFGENELLNYAKSFFEYLDKNAKSEDFALIQGDFGLTFLLVKFCLENDITPLYATTKRDVVINENGLKTSIFKHVKFRKYVI
ncbi:hypothetical protein F1B92_06895 [Campylobacter sp. FMV-PI01]|uniref:CRISPR-associated protein n=1 Tax=Campylobacter portucalensis TaxID=2608384 RepID=A0A6L5WKE2_9BACT|nr:CRISPR-associated protein Csx20 [Campylobacter portucalensis]MSN96892.1 hypothetical protein [Campylobacter portucalensis]